MWGEGVVDVYASKFLIGRSCCFQRATMGGRCVYIIMLHEVCVCVCIILHVASIVGCSGVVVVY